MIAPAVTRMINEIIKREAGYVDHWADSGGPTKFGITERVARLEGYSGDMRDLPEHFAFDVYLRQYYKAPGFDRVAEISQPTAVELTDTGVNMGQGVAITFLQRALNVLNKRGTIFADLKVDGHIGVKTLEALQVYVETRKIEGVHVLLQALNCLQGTRYIEIVESRQKDEENIYGWLRARVQL